MLIRLQGQDVEVVAGPGVAYRTRVFGHEAIQETRKLMELNPPVWDGGPEPKRLSEVHESGCEAQVLGLLRGQPTNIIVIRRSEKNVTAKPSYWSTLQRLAGYMPLECQGQCVLQWSSHGSLQRDEVPGFVHQDTGIEFSTDEGRFTLNADQMIACSQDQSKNGVNFLGGTWSEDTDWLSFIRSCAVSAVVTAPF